MKLVLVESPTKARKLTTYLGEGFTVRASIGHIRDLPKSKMGVDIEHNFEPEYLIPKDKVKVVKELKTLSKNATEIIIATDPDREGEAIGWHLIEILEENKKDKRFIRATFHEITKSAILDAIAHPTTLNLDLVNAQQARRVLDRLVGYSVSPVLWKKIRYGLSAGRVQSVALRLIVEREKEIEAFKAEEYWEIDVLLDTNLQNTTKVDTYSKDGKFENTKPSMIVARVTDVNGKEYNPKSAADAASVVEKLDTAKYIVRSAEKKERRRVSLPPFTTSTLQQQSANRFGYTSKNTMRMAQDLYEEGLITYHRTDSVNLSQQALDMSREFISKEFGKQYLPQSARFFANKSKNAQEAHEAIRVTDVTLQSERLRSVSSRFSEQHVKLYDLIWRRFISSQMTEAVYDQTSLVIDATAASETYTTKSSGSILKFDGWMKLFPNQGDVIIPDVVPAQSLGFVEKNAAQKFTQPPPRYNDASLIKTLEKEGIGRPSTYASIISVIEDRGYVERKEKKFFPSAIGMAVSDFLVKHFQTIVDYKFTAKMEDDLDAIARGEQPWREVVKAFYDPLSKIVSQVVDTAERAQIPVEKTGETCPKCGTTEHGEVVIRSGKFGKFKSCSRFPDCDYTENIVHKLENILCPLCQKGDVIIKPTRYGKDFFGCSRYPACDWASWSKPASELRLTQAQWDQMKIERDERKAKRAATMGRTVKPLVVKPKRKITPRKKKTSSKKTA